MCIFKKQIHSKNNYEFMPTTQHSWSYIHNCHMFQILENNGYGVFCPLYVMAHGLKGAFVWCTGSSIHHHDHPHTLSSVLPLNMDISDVAYCCRLAKSQPFIYDGSPIFFAWRNEWLFRRRYSMLYWVSDDRSGRVRKVFFIGENHTSPAGPEGDIADSNSTHSRSPTEK